MKELFDSHSESEENPESEEELSSERKPSFEKIPCFAKTGKLIDCDTCLLGTHKYCQQMIIQIRRYAYKNLAGFSDDAKLTIISNAICEVPKEDDSKNLRGIMPQFNDYFFGEPSFFDEEFTGKFSIKELCKKIADRCKIVSYQCTIEWLNDILMSPDIFKKPLEEDNNLKNNETIKKHIKQIHELQDKADLKPEEKIELELIKRRVRLNRLILQILFSECPNYLDYEGNKGAKFNSFVKKILHYKMIDHSKNPMPKFKTADVSNFKSFINEVKNYPSMRARQYVYNKLCKNTKSLFGKSGNEKKDEKQIVQSIIADFNRFLIDETFYNSDHFKNLEDSEEILFLSRKTKRKDYEIKKLNRLVLESLYPLSTAGRERKEISINNDNVDESDNTTGIINEGMLPSPDPGPDDILVAEEERQKWKEKLNRLLGKSDEKGYEFIKFLIEITKLEEFEGLTDEEIGNRLGINRRTVIRKRQSAIEKMKELKSDEFYD